MLSVPAGAHREYARHRLHAVLGDCHATAEYQLDWVTTVSDAKHNLDRRAAGRRTSSDVGHGTARYIHSLCDILDGDRNELCIDAGIGPSVCSRRSGSPFNQALAAGTLDLDRFHSTSRRMPHLAGFAQVLAARRPGRQCRRGRVLRQQRRQTALIAERTLHAGYLEGVDVSGHCDPRRRALAYVSSSAFGGADPRLSGIGWPAVLPCFWVYQNVGSHIADAVGELAGIRTRMDRHLRR